MIYSTQLLKLKIGSSSILFDGNGDLLEVGGTSNWYDFGADGNPWTMEAYVRFDTVSITQKLFWQNNTYIGIEYVTGSGIKVRLNNGGINFTASWSPSINTWYHVAVVRQTNNTTTVYIDGTSIGSGTISGNFTFQEATDLALLLRSGALPTPLDVVEERTVGPDLGEDSIKSGITSLIVGFFLVILFMLYKYRLFGLVANIALIANLLMLVGVLTILEATLTLPGIAGIILTVGMAVDANVLIFERIKEELKNENNSIVAF